MLSFALMRMDESADDTVVKDLQQVLALSERIGTHDQHVYALAGYAAVMHSRGQLDEAESSCKRAYAEAEQLRNPFNTMMVNFTCARVASDRGDVDTAAKRRQVGQDIANKIGDFKAIARGETQLAQVDMAHGDWAAARDRLQRAIEKLNVAEATSGETIAWSLLALCHDRALMRARALRSRITERITVFDADLALAQLGSPDAEPKQVVGALLALADDAEKRFWLANALEARLAALEGLKRNNDPAAVPLQRQIEATARQHGFNRVLARLQVKKTN
ncbi:MAG: hypothetical protein E6K53_16095 [Gammaproteobacteria bacterium]|nr:MAG: hypothetical protein E6K53_16095 [Gammaproteobacteria bacterium]